MKKILVFILVTTTFLSVYANKEHSQDIIIKNIDYNTRDNKSFIRFEIDVTKGNTYYMGVWMIPSKLITTFVDNEILPANTYCYMRNIPKGIYFGEIHS